MIFTTLLCLATLFHSPPISSSNEVIGELNGIAIHQGGDNSVHWSKDGYRYGLKWQCVEFVKRYYYDHLSHKMPNVWGHAIEYFDTSIPHGSINKSRGLLQFANGQNEPPKEDDLLILNWAEPYGHVAIVNSVSDNFIEIAQQNAGPAYIKLSLEENNGHYTVGEDALGWLRIP